MTTPILSRREFLRAGLAIGGGLFGLSALQPVSPILDKILYMPMIAHPGAANAASRAETTFQTLQKRFAVAGTARYADVLNPKAGERPYASMWSYGALLSAVNALAAIPGRKGTYAGVLRELIAGLDEYYDTGSTPSGYDSYIRAEGGGQKYYDDNEWIGLEFIRAYRTLGNPVYLAKAQEILRFTLSGWSDDMGGGIYWRQGDDSTKNTCSNAPTAVLALQIYQETKDASVRDWAVKILNWLKAFKAADSGVYYDNLSKTGKMDRSTYTYNTGAVLHANALLYAITGEQGYRLEAKSLAEASILRFAPQARAGQPRLFPNTPWFNAVLLRGYLALAEIDPDAAQPCLQAIADTLESAWQNARGADGLFSPDPSGRSGKNDPHRTLLDQAGMVEMYALMGGAAG